MLELARDLVPLLRAGTPVAAVTVTAVEHSAPRGVGATMAVTLDGTVIGSISGGCVEADAVMLARLTLRTDHAQTARFGFSDTAAHAAGLACGGRVEVIAYRLNPDDPVMLASLAHAAEGRGATLAVRASGAEAGQVISMDDVSATLERDPVRADALSRAEAAGESLMLHAAYDGDDVLVLAQAAPSRLIILGSGEHASALCRLAAAAGFAVTVCDVWETLVTAERFPDAETLVVGVPHDYLRSLDHRALGGRTAVCVLTHDERLDVPAIAAALSMPVGFVGAMGARGTVAHRANRLRDSGVCEIDLARLHSPLGLDLAGAEPVETAISVLAEIVASRHGGSGRPLREIAGPLHRARTVGASSAEHTGARTAEEAMHAVTQTPADRVSTTRRPAVPADREHATCGTAAPSEHRGVTA